jgi:hypothetical protein
MQCFRRLRGSCQSFDGFDIQEVKGGRICKCRYLDSICFSRNAVVFCLVKLSAVTASQDERRGQCSTWTTDPRNALMIYSVLMKIDAYSSFFTYPSLHPKTQAMLSVWIRMWQFLSFSGMVKKGMIIAIISNVVVLDSEPFSFVVHCRCDEGFGPEYLEP